MKERLVAVLKRRAALRRQRQMRKQALSRRCLQMLFLAALILVGLGMLHPLHFAVVSLSAAPSAAAVKQDETGRGAGNSTETATTPALCNPFDASCLADAVGQAVGTSILSGMQPVTDFFQNSSANIVTQTPADDSYANTMIETINQDLVHAVDVAFACLLLIGGYNIIIGHHWRLEKSSITELIPRAVLVVCAVHFNLFFIGLFIDLNNALCNDVIAAASLQTLTNIISGFTSVNVLAGLLLVILIIVVLILLLFLLAQMIMRLALVALLIAVAPLALACFILPQTMRWGRLWFTTFSSAVLVQFLQVTALCVGGILITSIGALATWHVAHQLAEVFLAIGMVILTLKIPGMLQTAALQPMVNTSNSIMDMVSGGGNAGSGGSSGAETAAQLAELIAML